MKVQTKTKEELINELRALQLQYDTLISLEGGSITKQLERYNGLLINLGAGVVIHKSDTSIVYCNPRAEELLGLSIDQMQGKLAIDPEWKFLDEHNNTLQLEQYPVNQIFSSNKPIKNFVAGVNRPNKKDIVWLIVNGFPIFNRDDKITEIVISFIDITIHKNLENRLLELNDFKETLITSLQDGFAIVNAEGIQTQVNLSFCKMTGFSNEELVGTKAPFPYWPPEEYENINAAFQKTLNNEELRFELIFMRKNGERFPVNVAPVAIKNKEGLVISFAATIADITESKKAQTALKENEERYRILVENAPEALVLVDMTTQKFVSVSQSAVELFKMTKEELLNSGVLDISPEYQPDGTLSAVGAMEKISLAINGGKPSFEWTHKDSDGRLIPCEVILVKLSFDNKVLVRGSVRDISERKKAEQYQQLQFTIGQVLSQSETIAECATKVCEAVGKSSGWEFSSLWMFDEKDNKLHHSKCWYASTALVNNFGEASQSFAFSKGVGLPGRVLESGNPLWIKDIQVDKNFPRAKIASVSNLHAALAFPIQSNKKVIGVLEVLSVEIKEPDEALLTMFESIGKMICQFILRKRAELEIKKSNDRYRDLLNNLEAGVVLYSPDTSIISCNPKGLELLGLGNEQIIGKLANELELQFVDENNNPLPFEQHPVNQVIANKKPIKNFIAGVNRSTNKIVWLIIHGFPEFDHNHNIIEIVISFIDITENIEVEKALQKSESYLKETLRIADLGTYTIDIATGRWTASTILERILGIDSNFDKTFEGGKSLVHPDWQKIMEDYFAIEVIKKRNKFDIEYKIIRNNDKAERWVHGIGDLKYDSNNQPIALVATVQDITEIKEAENLLKHKNDELEIAKAKAEESDRLKSAFLANMSHEIRTPMNGILGFADLLKQPELTGSEMQEYIDIIQKSGKRMLNIINDIVDISRIESGMMEIALKESNINEQIEYVYTFFRPEVEAKGMKLFYKNDLPNSKANLITDSEKLFAILTNLVKNAIKYSDAGEIEFGYRKKENNLEFYVKDTGIGIPQSQFQSIFERFIQVDITNKMARQGSGLGLSITKAYVEMLGGKIWVESAEGVGSTFYFTLPFRTKLEEDDKPLNENSVNNLYHSLKKLKILVCDDDEISKLFMSLAVKEISKELLKARTGLEAIEICQSNPDLDLILMDSQMPIMNGYEATKKIRLFNDKVIIIAQTGYGMAEDRLKSIEVGCNDYISKPFGKEELLNLIAKHFS